jgi:hypothetical protein
VEKMERKTMNNFYSTKEDVIYLYEVTDPQGVAIWGGEKIEDMFDWYQQIRARIDVSLSPLWESDRRGCSPRGQTYRDYLNRGKQRWVRASELCY